ncbi:PAQR family membrane homeostasis protein TrhA [Asticcacaulis benevestitus]|uniref:Hemolysin III n=1 Tax=Asticcacaulis benevestitus DSM 16100 = ATCC BAA-896 TaxID=1121022 RepID=V4PWR5_9CAUL|nr:hemolysin III family protein [Asticcacaulis benevestitus]ESQ92816.1 hypothetical protein ABENE_06860 [Asticcacaulis benevestitus DSM 16100 = ATCC BAA-896]
MVKNETLHYPTSASRSCDFIVHMIGLVFAAVGAAVGLTTAIMQRADGGKLIAIAVYSLGLIAMFSFSTAYNFAPSKHQPFLRRLDHAGVFVMIAASYTPFTTQALTGNWATGMTVAVWALATFGVLGKLFMPDLGKMYWIGFYLLLGWLVVIAVQPLMRSVPMKALVLLVCGGVAYSVGTIFYANKRLIYRRAIWHAHVLIGAALHYFAILFGIALATSPI